jgi:outer membrane protein assembly factor BamE (lipoprotein component of BamABCDE complex)
MGCFLLGCTPRIDTHGDPLAAERISQVVPGVHGRDDVAALLGSPSTTSPFQGDTWYYVSGRTEAVAFFANEEIDRQVIAVRFDERGVVSGIDRFGRERGQDVAIVARETPTFGTDLSLVQEFFGNLGRFNKEADEENRRGR